MAGRRSDGVMLFAKTESQVLKLAKKFAKTLQSGDVVALHGDLGVGKTTFVKGIVAALTVHKEHSVQSPTFNYLTIYEGNPSLFHFDLYRLEGNQPFLQMGFLDYLGGEEGICLIEWAERISPLLPPKTKHVSIEHAEGGGRKIDF